VLATSCTAVCTTKEIGRAREPGNDDLLTEYYDAVEAKDPERYGTDQRMTRTRRAVP